MFWAKLDNLSSTPRGTQKSPGLARLCRWLTTGRRSYGHPLGGRQPWSLTDVGRGMSDGREDREERKKRRGREQRENCKDRIDRDYVDEWEQRRVESLWFSETLLFLPPTEKFVPT